MQILYVVGRFSARRPTVQSCGRAHLDTSMICALGPGAGLVDILDGEVELPEYSVPRKWCSANQRAPMSALGQYGAAYLWRLLESAFRVGLPAKSGVGGGILAVAPGKASIAVWSSGLDRNGNSVLGSIALEQLAKEMHWSVFGNRCRRGPAVRGGERFLCGDGKIAIVTVASGDWRIDPGFAYDIKSKPVRPGRDPSPNSTARRATVWRSQICAGS